MSLFNHLIRTTLPLVPKPVVKIFSKRYVAGPHLEDAVRAAKLLNQKNMSATLDILGESTRKKDESEKAVKDYLHVLDVIEKENLNCGISLKPTQLGMLIDYEFCFQNIKTIVDYAASKQRFVRIDMEDSSVTEKTVQLYETLRREYDNVGIVIQAYLRKSIRHIKQAANESANFRICKGIYIEPRRIAYRDPQLVNENFTLLMETAFERGSFVGIATHDEKVVWQALRIIEEKNLTAQNYEFQMLLGVDEELRGIIVNAGHPLRVYIPFGEQWHAYCVRRLKENPQIAKYVLKAIFKLK